jgi:hypothetical protein
MNNNTLRFGVVRALAFGGLLVAGAWAGRVAAEVPVPATAAPNARPALVVPVSDELQSDAVRELDSIDVATRNDLIVKAAAAASIAPRGFGLVAPALIVAPAQ